MPAEKFAGIEGLEVVLEMSGLRENIRVRHWGQIQ